VIALDEESEGGKATVECMGRNLTLLNKTGEKLSVGDSVWVHYWTNLANGYIALRNGLPNVNAGSFNISNAVAMLETQASIYTVSEEVIDVDVENSIKVKYGNGHNIIIANETPIIVSELDNTSTLTEVFNLADTLDSGLISTEREGYYSSVSVSGVEKIYTVVVGDFINNVWKWNADVVGSYPIYNSSDLAFANFCKNSNDGYTLRTRQNNPAQITTFNDLGVVLLTKKICAPITDCPYGYAECRVFGMAKESDVYVSMISSRTIMFPFKNEAEYNYAVTTLTKSEIIPSN
jgi:hypothetical protein